MNKPDINSTLSEILPIYEKQFVHRTTGMDKSSRQENFSLDVDFGITRFTFCPNAYGPAKGLSNYIDDPALRTTMENYKNIVNATVDKPSTCDSCKHNHLEIAFTIGVTNQLDKDGTC